jgi:hypothetical protein
MDHVCDSPENGGACQDTQGSPRKAVDLTVFFLGYGQLLKFPPQVLANHVYLQG